LKVPDQAFEFGEALLDPAQPAELAQEKFDLPVHRCQTGEDDDNGERDDHDHQHAHGLLII